MIKLLKIYKFLYQIRLTIFILMAFGPIQDYTLIYCFLQAFAKYSNRM